MTHSAAPRVPLFCSYHILTSSVIYYWTDTRQLGIHLLNRSWNGIRQWDKKLRQQSLTIELQSCRQSVEKWLTTWAIWMRAFNTSRFSFSNNTPSRCVHLSWQILLFEKLNARRLYNAKANESFYKGNFSKRKENTPSKHSIS